MTDAAQLVLEEHGDEDDAGSILELGRCEVATGPPPAANCALPRRVGRAALGASACKTGPVTEPHTTNGLLLAFAEMLYGDHADADAAERGVSQHRRDIPGADRGRDQRAPSSASEARKAYR